MEKYLNLESDVLSGLILLNEKFCKDLWSINFCRAPAYNSDLFYFPEECTSKNHSLIAKTNYSGVKSVISRFDKICLSFCAGKGRVK